MKLKSEAIWDYEVDERDLKKPEILKWYLERKINLGDWSGIRFQDLQKNLACLNIDPAVKELLRDFIKRYAKPIAK